MCVGVVAGFFECCSTPLPPKSLGLMATITTTNNSNNSNNNDSSSSIGSSSSSTTTTNGYCAAFARARTWGFTIELALRQGGL